MVWGFAARYPGHIAVAALALLCRGSRDLGRPLRVQADHRQRLRRAAPARPATSRRWFEYLLLLVGVMALATAVRYYFVSWLGERTVADIRLAVHRNLLRLSPGFFEENRPAEITSRHHGRHDDHRAGRRNHRLGRAAQHRHGHRLRRHPVRARAQARRPDAARRSAGRHRRSSSSAAGCARCRPAARTASPTSAPSPAKCSAR